MSKSSNCAVTTSGALGLLTFALVATLLAGTDLDAQVFVERPNASRTAEYLWTLVEPGETNPELPSGTLFRNDRDFLLCGGRQAGSLAPPGNVTIRYRDQNFNDVAEFNNATVDLLRPASVEDRELLERGLARFEAGLAADPLFLPFVYNRGRVLTILGRRVEARAAFRTALNLLPSDAGTVLRLGQVHQALGDFIAAREAYRTAASLDPASLKPLLRLGHLARAQGQPALANRYYETVLDRFDDQAEALYGLAAVERLEGRDLAALQILLRFDPHELDGSWREDYDLRWHLELAELCYDLRNFACATENFNRLLEKPQDEIFLELRPSYVRGRLARIGAINAEGSQ